MEYGRHHISKNKLPDKTFTRGHGHGHQLVRTLGWRLGNRGDLERWGGAHASHVQIYIYITNIYVYKLRKDKKKKSELRRVG